jgi:hypothetical protein
MKGQLLRCDILDMKNKNFMLNDFDENVQKDIKSITPSSPRLILDENQDAVGVVMSPEQYASMCDQLVFCKSLALAVKRLTGESDLGKLSMPEFLETCKLDDSFLAAECSQ